jgi:hypothetical protein
MSYKDHIQEKITPEIVLPEKFHSNVQLWATNKIYQTVERQPTYPRND